MKKNKKGNVELTEIAKALEVDSSIVNNFLFGLAGCPKLGEGLTLNNRLSFTSWKMSAKDADEFVRRVKGYIKKVAVEKDMASNFILTDDDGNVIFCLPLFVFD